MVIRTPSSRRGWSLSSGASNYKIDKKMSLLSTQAICLTSHTAGSRFVGVPNHRLVNLCCVTGSDSSARIRHKVYTSSGGTSLRPVRARTLALRFAVGVTNGREREHGSKSLGCVCTCVVEWNGSSLIHPSPAYHLFTTYGLR